MDVLINLMRGMLSTIEYVYQMALMDIHFKYLTLFSVMLKKTSKINT